MKNLKTLFFTFAILTSIAFVSCEKIKYADVGETISLQENIKGTWKVSTASQIDNDAVNKNFPLAVQKLDLTTRFPYNTVVFAFNGETTGTYTITNPGGAPLFFPLTGTWSLDGTKNGPVRVKLVSGTQTAFLDFAKAYRASDNKLSLKFSRANSDGKVFLSYEFNFNRN